MCKYLLHTYELTVRISEERREMTKKKTFVTVKSDISNCICKIVNAKGLLSTTLNYSAISIRIF